MYHEMSLVPFELTCFAAGQASPPSSGGTGGGALLEGLGCQSQSSGAEHLWFQYLWFLPDSPILIVKVIHFSQ